MTLTFEIQRGYDVSLLTFQRDTVSPRLPQQQHHYRSNNIRQRSNCIPVGSILPCAGKTLEIGSEIVHESDFSDTAHNCIRSQKVLCYNFSAKMFGHKIDRMLGEKCNIQKNAF